MKKSTFIVFSIFALFICFSVDSLAQITNAELKDSQVIVSRNQQHTIKIAVCGTCKIAGFNSAYVVVYSGPKVVIYNYAGQIRGKLLLKHRGKIIEVGKKEITVEDALGYYLYYDFRGVFLRRVLKNM